MVQKCVFDDVKVLILPNSDARRKMQYNLLAPRDDMKGIFWSLEETGSVLRLHLFGGIFSLFPKHIFLGIR